jgi:hypothetical protein
MKRLIRWLPHGLLGGVLFAIPAVTQSQPASGDAVGAGYGSVVLTCSGCDTERQTNPALLLRIGGALRPGVVLSGEITAFSKEKDGVTGTLAWGNLVAQFYPNPAQGFFLKAGAGLGWLEAHTHSSTTTVKLETKSFGLIGGIGYDIHVGGGFSLSPFADYVWAAKSEAKVNAQSTGVDLGANLFHIGLAAAWR